MAIVTKTSISSKKDSGTGISLDKIYPIGSIYLSASLSTVAQVEEALGGTWEAWGAGRVPVGVDTSQTEFNTVGKTGGSKTQTLTKDQLPTIQGTLPHVAYGENKARGDFVYSTASELGVLNSYEGASNSTSNYSHYKLDIGKNDPHNNLQPYITCYMYKRIA